MCKKLWVHVISHDLRQALYVNGVKEFEDDSIDVVEAFDILKEKMNGEPCEIGFTDDDVEFFLDDELNFDDVFPEKIKPLSDK